MGCWSFLFAWAHSTGLKKPEPMVPLVSERFKAVHNSVDFLLLQVVSVKRAALLIFYCWINCRNLTSFIHHEPNKELPLITCQFNFHRILHINGGQRSQHQHSALNKEPVSLLSAFLSVFIRTPHPHLPSILSVPPPPPPPPPLWPTLLFCSPPCSLLAACLRFVYVCVWVCWMNVTECVHLCFSVFASVFV